MKRFYAVISLLVIVAVCLPIWVAERQAASACTHTFGPGSVTVHGGGIAPGSVVCLRAGDYGSLNLYDLQGTAAAPIIVRNEGGRVRVNDWVMMKRSGHVRLTGTGTPGIEYGIHFTMPFGIVEKPHHVEVDHLEFTERVFIKEYDDPSYTMTGFRFHHNYSHDSPNTIFYIGNAAWSPGQYEGIGIEIDHNIFENLDSQAIKVVGFTGCKIHHNMLVNVMQAPGGLKHTAIKSSVGTDCEIYNNVILGSGGRGIQINTSNPIKVYNNLLVDTGQDPSELNDAIIAWGDNIAVYNNTIIGAERNGLHFGGSSPRNNWAYNNIILGTKDDSIDEGSSPSANFHHNLTKEGGYTVANLDFVDPGNDDYHLRPGSPAVDAGADSGLRWDLDDRPRPVGAYDIGAYEFAGSLPTSTPTNTPTTPLPTNTPAPTNTPLPTNTPTLTPSTPTPEPKCWKCVPIECPP